jgi:peptidoglycan/LPS O-acetylase OafA/YrhL
MSGRQLNLNIQQLRGIAVISVVLFHLNFIFAKTGYLGVDTFFVISGFLMAMLYGNTINLNSTKIFFYKRAVRLLPAYWFTILTTSTLALLFCLPHEVTTQYEHSFWSYFLLPNIGFWSDAEYWGGSQFRPLLHLWSLGVEFQFYLIYPIICKIFNTQFKRFILMSTSLLVYILVNEISAKTAFYMMPTRLWQFLLGIIAFEFSKKINIKQSSRIFQILIFLLFVLLILPVNITPQSVILITIPTTFIAAGAALVSNSSYAKIKNGFIERFLVWVGKYSFSIYLVHFPIIVFLQYEPFGGTITGVNSFFELILFLALLVISSKITYLFFEKHTRYNFNTSKLVLWGSLSLLLVTSFTVSSPKILEKKFDITESQISNAWLDQSEDRCGKVFKFFHPKEAFCPIGDSSYVNKYLLVGNSHTNSIKYIFAEFLNENKISLYINSSNSAINDSQADMIVNQAKKIYFSKIIFHSRADLSNIESLAKILPKLNEMGIQSYYILPVPEYQFHVPKKMYETSKNNKQFPFYNYSQYLNLNKNEIKAVSRLSEKFGIKVLQTSRIFCDPVCEVSDSLGLFYFDSNHLTIHGSKKMIPIFKEIVGYP